jgi:hypothetical protein
MQEGLIQCKECQFWIPYVEEDPIVGSKLSDFGLCFQFRSVNWFSRMHKDVRCEHGKLKKKEIRTQ